MMRLALKRICAVAVGVMLALAMAELALRVLKLAPTDGVVTVTAAQYARLPGILAPNQRLVDRRKPALAHRVTVDSLGFRGPDFPRQKPAGEFRAVVAGDSFTYGDFVDDDQTLPAQLERRWRERCGNARVINAGLGGATITDEARMIERALPLAPDVVLLVFGENDVTDLAGTPMWTRLAENRAAKSRFPLSLAYPVLRHTALWNLGLAVVATMQTRELAAAVPQGTTGRSQDVTMRLRAHYHRALVGLRDTLDAHGIPLLFAVYPGHRSVSGEDPPEQVRWAVGLAHSVGIRVFDLLPVLQATGLPTDTLYLLPYDGHSSPLGYVLAAEYLASQLLLIEPLAHRCSRT